MEKNKVFVDTSVLISALLSSRGGSFYILTNLNEKFEIQINQYVFEETLQVLNEKFSSQSQLKDDFFLLLGLGQIDILPNPKQEKLKLTKEIINKKDAPILVTALKESNYLLTLDKDFLNEEVTEFAEQKDLIVLKPKKLIQSFEE